MRRPVHRRALRRKAREQQPMPVVIPLGERAFAIGPVRHGAEHGAGEVTALVEFEFEQRHQALTGQGR